MSEHKVGIQEPTLFLTDDDVAEVADWGELIDALRAAYSQPQREDSTPERTVAVTSSGWQRHMPSAPTGFRLGGIKTISASVKNGLASYLISLFDQETSGLSALLDGNRVTGLRTGATAAVAVDSLAPEKPLSAAVIGSGFEAQNLLRAVARVRTLSEVRVYSPTEANRRRFAEELGSELRTRVIPVESAQQALLSADLVLCAARSHDETPTIYAEWVESQALIVSIGSTTPDQRELDPEILRKASLIVADAKQEVVTDSGDMLSAQEAGIDVAGKTISLTEALAEENSKKHTPGVVVYKSTGSGFQDIVLAERIYELARQRGIGTALAKGILTVSK